jgi:hypothetical protein
MMMATKRYVQVATVKETGERHLVVGVDRPGRRVFAYDRIVEVDGIRFSYGKRVQLDIDTVELEQLEMSEGLLVSLQSGGVKQMRIDEPPRPEKATETKPMPEPPETKKKRRGRPKKQD